MPQRYVKCFRYKQKPLFFHYIPYEKRHPYMTILKFEFVGEKKVIV